ncbi:MAG: hypothetical protein JSW58_12770 [Candidatus Latescibacterota bacterium]|nr:MAG: hypothetical protein JSW58_12770 [Candidatus Latescibacterota bacterium]
MRYVLLVVLAVLTALVYLPVAQDDPAFWVDIRADSITFGFPAPDSIRLTAHYSILNGMLMDTIIVSDIGLFLDGVPVYGEPIDVTMSTNDCYNFQTEEECKGDCVYSAGPPIEYGECKWVPRAPNGLDTLPPSWYCVCEESYLTPPQTIHYSGEDFASFELDLGNMVEEADEDNNSISVNLTGVAVEPSTWGRIKEIYEAE